jgi:hypothetical protein
MKKPTPAPKTKPKGVPKTAEWDWTTSSWEHGPRNAHGRHGAWTAWNSSDGSLFWKATYRDDKLHGTQTYFRDGKRAMTMTYANGEYASMKVLAKLEPTQPRKKSKVPKLRGTPYERLVQLDEAMRAAKHDDYAGVAWKKVKPGDVTKAEKKLGTKLPPSYVAFVTEHGVFHIEGTDDEVYNRLLPPLEIAKITLALRKRERFVKDGLCFQGNLYDDNFYAFRVSSRRKDGEMTVGEWNHDDDSFWPKRFKTFDEHLSQLCANWCDELG